MPQPPLHKRPENVAVRDEHDIRRSRFTVHVPGLDGADFVDQVVQPGCDLRGESRQDAINQQEINLKCSTPRNCPARIDG